MTSMPVNKATYYVKRVQIQSFDLRKKHLKTHS